MLGFIVLILALISGLICAFSLSILNRYDDDVVKEVIEALSMFGKKTWSDQREYLSYFVQLGIMIKISYFILSIFYFYGEIIPLILTGSLIIFNIVSFVIQRRQLQKAKSVTEAIKPKLYEKGMEFFEMVTYAIHIAYIL